MDTLLGNNSLHLCLPSQWHLVLKDTVCSPKNRFFLVRVDPFWKSFVIQGSKQVGRRSVFFSLVKMAENDESCDPSSHL